MRPRRHPAPGDLQDVEHADDPVLEPVDDQDRPDAPAEEQHPDERDGVGDDEGDDRPDRRGRSRYQARRRSIAEMLPDRFLALHPPEVPGRPGPMRRRAFVLRRALRPSRSAPRRRAPASPRYGAVDGRRGRRTGRRASATALPPAATMRSPASIPAASAGLPSSTPRTRTPSRSGRPTERRSRRATCDGAIATPSRGSLGRLAPGQGIDPLTQRRIGRQGEVEPLADPVRVETDEPAGRIDERPARRSRREGSGVLDAAVDAPAAGAAERPRDGRDESERHATSRRRATPRHRRPAVPTVELGAIGPTRAAPRRRCRRR